MAGSRRSISLLALTPLVALGLTVASASTAGAAKPKPAAAVATTTTTRPPSTTTTRPATTTTTRPATTTTTAAPTTTTAAPTTTTAAPTTTTTAAPATTTTAAAAPAAATVPTGYARRLVEDFSTSEWWRAQGLLARPWNTGLLPDGGTTGGTALGVRYNAGAHDGTTWQFLTGTADDVHIRYRMRLPANWNVAASDSNVKFPGFGNPLFTGLGGCLAGCEGMPSNGVTSYSARTDIHETGRPGWYVYHAGMSQTVPSYGWGLRWPGQLAFQTGRWYTIDLRIRMNTPGQNDGILQTWVDGVNVFDGRAFNFRTVDTLHVGSAWFDFHYGGSGVAPEQMILLIDDLVIEY